ncbi:MAG TPA: glycoside hydrolase family 3 protein [Chthoniobacterales bacterium]
MACFLAGCHPTSTTSHLGDDGTLDPRLDQQIGQLMMVGFKGPELTPEIRKTLQKLQPGGICLYKQNITDAGQVAKLNEQLRSCIAGGISPFIAVDQEGGTVVRIDNGVTVFPGNMSIGATRSTELAFRAGQVQGSELRLLGFNMNLAPVLDVPDNPAIATRAFSDEPELISQLGVAYIKAQQNGNVATIAKHFPGEGHSRDDSHYKLPVRYETANALEVELSPFCEAITQGVDGVMTAHVALPKVIGNELPATMSPEFLTGVLRQEYGFDGLILTDELESMRSISKFGVERAAVSAIKAGADMVFVAFSPETQLKVRSALMKAVRSGDISRARFEEALRHVLALKLKRRIFDEPLPVPERLAELRGREGGAVAEEIAQKSITSFRLAPNALPLNAQSRIGVVTDSQNFTDAVHKWAPQAKVLLVDSESMKHKRALRQRVQQLAGESDAVIAAFIVNSRLIVANYAEETGRPLVIVLMNVPAADFADEIPNARTVLETYSYQPVALAAAADAIFGGAEMPGISPIRATEDGAVMTRTARAQ